MRQNSTWPIWLCADPYTSWAVLAVPAVRVHLLRLSCSKRAMESDSVIRARHLSIKEAKSQGWRYIELSGVVFLHYLPPRPGLSKDANFGPSTAGAIQVPKWMGWTLASNQVHRIVWMEWTEERYYIWKVICGFMHSFIWIAGYV